MISEQKKEMLKYYENGLYAYKQRKWDEAIQSFKKALEIDPDDGPSTLYFKRSNEYKKNPPLDDWDGVFVMTTK